MADEYIKREDVLSLKHRLHNHSKDTIELYPVYVISPDAVEKIPSADVAKVRHGKWVEKKGVLHPLETDGICTECGYETGFYNFFNFCPNCGADMRGGT